MGLSNYLAQLLKLQSIVPSSRSCGFRLYMLSSNWVNSSSTCKNDIFSWAYHTNQAISLIPHILPSTSFGTLIKNVIKMG